jgi:hypothetical protein
MFKTNKSQKGKVLALFVVLTFAAAGLAAVTFLSEPFAVAQIPGNDPNNCFRSNVTIDTCPIHTSFKGLSNDTTDCFKKIEETNVGTGEIQNYTKTVQSFVSLIPTDNKITTVNENIAGGSGPVKDMDGVWDLMKNGNMTRYDRQLVLDEVNILLTDAKPGFTKMQHDGLSSCITTELDSLGPTLNY